jgi:hypothetical protein
MSATDGEGAPFDPDPVIEAYKRDSDRTLVALANFAEELRKAGLR